ALRALPRAPRGRVTTELALERPRRGSEDLKLFKEFDAPFTLGLGVVDVKTHDVETPAVVAERIREALAILPADRLSVNPDCGLLHLPPQGAFPKPGALGEGAQLVPPALGGWATRCGA